MSGSEHSDHSSECSDSDYSTDADDQLPAAAHQPRSNAPRFSLPLSSIQQQQHAAVPKLGIPGLSLNRPSSHDTSLPPLTSRRPTDAQPQRFATATVLPSHAESPVVSPIGSDTSSDPVSNVSSSSRTLVQLVSYAFTVEQAVGEASMQLIRDRCVQNLGITADELSLFELQPLAAQGQTNLPRCVGVAINKSGFSLEALEGLLAENKRLAMAAERSAAALESLQHLVREQHQTVSKAQTLAAEKEAETRRLQDRCRYLEKEVMALRQQLQRSDLARLQGQMALDELKREFEALMSNILSETSAMQHDCADSVLTNLNKTLVEDTSEISMQHIPHGQKVFPEVTTSTAPSSNTLGGSVFTSHGSMDSFPEKFFGVHSTGRDKLKKKACKSDWT